MSEMNGGQLRHALKQVHMKENMQEEIIMNVRTQMADGTYRRNSFKRNMVSAAACLLVIGTATWCRQGWRRFPGQRWRQRRT